MDLAAQGGGNCELTKLNEIVTTPNGVTIIGYADMPARMASQASTMRLEQMRWLDVDVGWSLLVKVDMFVKRPQENLEEVNLLDLICHF